MITDHKNLIAGKWYACAFADDDRVLQWGAASIYRYDGDGCWSNEGGEEIDRLFDPYLQLYVAMDAADAYAQQP